MTHRSNIGALVPIDTNWYFYLKEMGSTPQLLRYCTAYRICICYAKL